MINPLFTAGFQKLRKFLSFVENSLVLVLPTVTKLTKSAERLYLGKKHPYPVLLGQKNWQKLWIRGWLGKRAKTMQEGLFFLLYNLCFLTGRDGVLLQHGHSGHSVLTQETRPHYFQKNNIQQFYLIFRNLVRSRTNMYIPPYFTFTLTDCLVVWSKVEICIIKGLYE